MEKIIFYNEYITLGQLLKKLNYVSSGGDVKIFLEENRVLVNGMIETRRGKKLVSNDVLTIQNKSYLLKADKE
ncbi:S4 domain-containing protein YaaA [Alicyclobacillus tolerans]|uniref:S4 domain protein YaaA n=2 Tax=Alicyclobacillus tolerans TaxID=90970 RepID=A0ABT9LUH1_9BACL|nr:MULTISPECIES: S4 domain-containing protein YaaA [Alicyclobacillus]MDP9727908.1 S4 domain protein YaaA [Alicyclobacillus tengchongensis]QRF22249.1 S4 domain-containing protein YaaA [Alicyclobacillus sp. TC]SHK52048.1 S4 domain protein YaaA [Alicyclobacillus montanus]